MCVHRRHILERSLTHCKTTTKYGNKLTVHQWRDDYSTNGKNHSIGNCSSWKEWDRSLHISINSYLNILLSEKSWRNIGIVSYQLGKHTHRTTPSVSNRYIGVCKRIGNGPGWCQHISGYRWVGEGGELGFGERIWICQLCFYFFLFTGECSHVLITAEIYIF